MVLLGISALFAIIFVLVAMRANARFRWHDRLPMQWSLTGSVNWTAPRRIALGLLPALGMGLMLFTALITSTVGPRPGQEHLVVPVMFLMGVAVVAIQFLHFWLIDKTLKRNGG